MFYAFSFLINHGIRVPLHFIDKKWMYMHSSSIQLVKCANRYIPIVEPILKDNGIPADLKYMAVIESSLNPCAVSPAKDLRLSSNPLPLKQGLRLKNYMIQHLLVFAQKPSSTKTRIKTQLLEHN